jgi:hypothetical protein
MKVKIYIIYNKYIINYKIVKIYIIYNIYNKLQ